MTREELINFLTLLKEQARNSGANTFVRDVKIDSFNFVIDSAIKALEQEPRKGHWILTDVEGDRAWYCKCSECGKDPQDYISGTENWWLNTSDLPKFCPSCGSDNREVEE